MRIPVRAIIGSTLLSVALAVGAATASAAALSTSHGAHPDHDVPRLMVSQGRPVSTYLTANHPTYNGAPIAPVNPGAYGQEGGTGTYNGAPIPPDNPQLYGSLGGAGSENGVPLPPVPTVPIEQVPQQVHTDVLLP